MSCLIKVEYVNCDTSGCIYCDNKHLIIHTQSGNYIIDNVAEDYDNVLSTKWQEPMGY